MLNLNEVKKALYTEKPTAKLITIKSGFMYYQLYSTTLKEVVHFKVPFTDMGDANFWPDMPGQLLNRWIYETKS